MRKFLKKLYTYYSRRPWQDIVMILRLRKVNLNELRLQATNDKSIFQSYSHMQLHVLVIGDLIDWGSDIIDSKTLYWKNLEISNILKMYLISTDCSL